MKIKLGKPVTDTIRAFTWRITWDSVRESVDYHIRDVIYEYYYWSILKNGSRVLYYKVNDGMPAPVAY